MNRVGLIRSRQKKTHMWMFLQHFHCRGGFSLSALPSTPWNPSSLFFWTCFSERKMTGDVLILISLYAVWKVESISPFKMLFDLFWGFFLAFPFFFIQVGCWWKFDTRGFSLWSNANAQTLNIFFPADTVSKLSEQLRCSRRCLEIIPHPSSWQIINLISLEASFSFILTSLWPGGNF